MSRPEDILIAEIRRELGAKARHCRLFRNPRGTFWAGKLLSYDDGTAVLAHASRLEGGLVDGAGDLIGWTVITVTPELVGQKLAVFTSAETKTERAPKARENQFNWRNAIIEAGGRAAIVRSVEDARRLVAVP
jgi:hypothetical protein